MNSENTNQSGSTPSPMEPAGTPPSPSDTLRPVLDRLLSGVHEAVDRLAVVAAQAADKVELTGDYVKDGQARLGRHCRNYVREKPLTTLVAAVASGYLLGWLMRNKR